MHPNFFQVSTSTFLGILNRCFCGITRTETNSSHLKMDGWNTSFLLRWPIFRCYISFRECRKINLKKKLDPWPIEAVNIFQSQADRKSLPTHHQKPPPRKRSTTCPRRAAICKGASPEVGSMSLPWHIWHIVGRCWHTFGIYFVDIFGIYFMDIFGIYFGRCWHISWWWLASWEDVTLWDKSQSLQEKWWDY